MLRYPVLHEALTHEETAIMVSPGNLNEWVEAVSRLRDDEACATAWPSC